MARCGRNAVLCLIFVTTANANWSNRLSKDYVIAKMSDPDLENVTSKPNLALESDPSPISNSNSQQIDGSEGVSNGFAWRETFVSGKRYLQINAEKLQQSLLPSGDITCDYGFYKVEGGIDPPCSKYQHSKEDSAAAQVWCCNCNQGEQWHNWEWTYVQNARESACVSNIYISSKGWIVVRMISAFVVGAMALFLIVPLLITCTDNGPRVGCCVKGPFLFGCRDKTGCWWRTDSRSLIMIAFLPFYICEALAMTKYVSSMDLNIRPRYDTYSQSLGLASLSLTLATICMLPLTWFCCGVNGQMRGRRHIMRREKNGFTISLFHSWHLHTYFYYCSLAAEVALIVIAATWICTVELGEPEILNDDEVPLSNISISPSRQDLFSLVETVFWIHVLSLLHILIGIRVFNAQYFKAKFSNVKLGRRGACFFVDYCVEEPLIKSLDCDYKKFIMDNNGKITCAKETFASDERTETKAAEVKGRLLSPGGTSIVAATGPRKT